MGLLELDDFELLEGVELLTGFGLLLAGFGLLTVGELLTGLALLAGFELLAGDLEDEDCGHTIWQVLIGGGEHVR